MSGPGFIAEDPLSACEFCSKIDECRPYGPNDERICFDCGMLDEETTTKKMNKYLFGEEE
jgi:hypothetical protein